MSSGESRSAARMPMASLCTTQYHSEHSFTPSPLPSRIRVLERTFLNFNLNSCLVRRSILFLFSSFPHGATPTFLSSGNCSALSPRGCHRASKFRGSTRVIITGILRETEGGNGPSIGAPEPFVPCAEVRAGRQVKIRFSSRKMLSTFSKDSLTAENRGKF